MKKTVLMLALLGFFAAIQGKSFDYLDVIRTKCLRETNFDGAILKEAINNGTIPDFTDDYGKFMTCSYKKQGYINEEGELQYDVIENFLSFFYERDFIKPRVRACKENEKGETNSERTHSFAKCIVNKLKESD